MMSLAVIGNYQIGKSSLVNALLEHNVALVGARGGGTTTTLQSQPFSFSSYVRILDTPGLGAKSDANETAKKDISAAHYLIYLHDNTGTLREAEINAISDFTSSGCSALFLMNCTNREIWSPDDEQNLQIAQSIEAELKGVGLQDCFLPIDGEIVQRVNLLWANYALGLLPEDSTEAVMVQKTFAREYKEEMNNPDFNLRSKILEQSHFPAIRDVIATLPNRWLQYAKNNLQFEKNKFIAIFKENMSNSIL